MNSEETDLPEGLIDVTDRLIVREFTPGDARAYYELIHSLAPKDCQELYKLTYDEFFEHLNAYITYQYGFYGYGNWGIFQKDTGTLIGMVGLINGSDSGIGELSYAVAPSFRGQGYAKEACAIALEYGRECGFTSFEVRIRKDNQASLHIASKLPVTIISTQE